MEAFDPDIIYSYLSLAAGKVRQLHERIYPSAYIEHEFDGRFDVHGLKPRYGFDPLCSLSTLFVLARHNPTAPFKILDSWHTETPSRFFTDNFGTYHYCRSTGMFPPDARTAGNLLSVVSPEHASPRFGIPPDLETLRTELEGFQFVAQRRAISLSLSSTIYAPKVDIRAGRWSGAFNLVVGEEFSDRLLFWNARLLIPSWLDRELCCFRVDPDQLQDEEFVSVLTEFLNLQNHVNAGSGGQPQLVVRSASLAADQLRCAYDRIRSLRLWSMVRSEAITSLEDVVPTKVELERAQVTFGEFELRRPSWTRFEWSPPDAHPPAVYPDHLTDAPPRQLFTNGHWISDFVFEDDGPRPPFSNSNFWMLARRWRVAGAFKVKYDASSPIPLHWARSGQLGSLSLPVCSQRSIRSIAVPTIEEAVSYAFLHDNSRNLNYKDPDPYFSPRAYHLSRSNEARYLSGILGMTNGLQRAAGLLLHPFLQEIFAALGGVTNPSGDNVASVISSLRERSRFEPAFDLKNEQDIKTLGTLIAKAAKTTKIPREFISYADLQRRWGAYCAWYWFNNWQPALKENDGFLDEEGSLDDCLIEFRSRKMLFQGHRWTCGRCHHRNWIDLDGLAAEQTCRICKAAEPTPVNIRWLFRPNDFLIECLRDHSVLSLIWTLSALRQRSRYSFMFVGPTWFWSKKDLESHDAEADLLVLTDGKSLLCEVKSSWNSLRRPHVDSLIDQALHLRPDIAMLAVMDTRQGRPKFLDQATTKLNDAGIDFELLTTDKFGPEHRPFLA
ncbi:MULTISPECIES: hypothetical protein [Bradyrhizobium]|uniref:hypothetical protein n=1 Tax=Bradyrhizobium TaxID=374 RepID=UPI001ED9F6B9|nr:hypothetical protein [Bradyrhizobium zhengyangense]MCG2644294.1 hypothetical protein [Bradyrhizobium zhengyangense]